MKCATMRRLIAMGVSVCLLATIGLFGGCAKQSNPLPPEATDCSGAGQDMTNLANLQKPDIIIYYGQNITKVYSAGTEEFEQVFALNQARQQDRENQQTKGIILLPPAFVEPSKRSEREKEWRHREEYEPDILEYVYTSTDYAPVVFEMKTKDDNQYTTLADDVHGPFGILKSAEELLAYIDSTMA